ncbi:hypothetical protein GRI44_03235 [Altererythrobacter confluentis]|uniref:Cytochrome c domain-containing protein n=1 Tax=Allopontixanthobacter confluentis TaxID=1849021 RepID=A0A6L7GEA1_9SPHN|nr:hypothetical protein [Allopontixanthobacter confluentis]MXP13766.1 hypothetical protein [Allopontixanthobacter confluentis]
MTRSFAACIVALGLSACQGAVSQQQPVEVQPSPSQAVTALSGPAQAGYNLSEALCSGCHAISAGGISPNPQSPTFAMVANMPGLTEVTLRDFLRDSHNFPETMNFEVVEEDVDVLAAYIITLRQDDFRPPIQ